ncbi:hypothetical protein KSS87_009828, partial [Heliosperma pusillum]
EYESEAEDEYEYESEADYEYEYESEAEYEYEYESEAEDEPQLENQVEDEPELENQADDEPEEENQTDDDFKFENHADDECKPENQTFCLMNNKSYTKTIVELHGKSILASNQGWLILQERVNPSKYSLWNPITRQCLLLPELLDPPEEEKQPCTCIFTSPPDGNTPCVVLLFFERLVFLCWPTTRKEDCKWVKQSLEHDGKSVQIAKAAAPQRRHICNRL